MKCPYCNKEIKDDAIFCGFCGKQIPQVPLKSASPSSPPDEVNDEINNKTDNVPTENFEKTRKHKAKNKTKKKHIMFSVFLAFVLLSFISGSVLGFLTTREIVAIESLFPNNDFKWTNFSEGQTGRVENDDTLESSENKKENIENYVIANEEIEGSLLTETTQPSSETATPVENPQLTENDVHYAKYSGNSLVVIDDKAHIWEEATIDEIMVTAKAMSELSRYSIMIVITNDIFDMTLQEFSDDYYDGVLTSDENEGDLIADGYIFLISLSDHEYYLSTYGKALDFYADTAMDEFFDEIHQFMVDENYVAAVTKVIEKTIY